MVEMSVPKDGEHVTKGESTAVPGDGDSPASGQKGRRKQFFEKFGTLLKQRSEAFLLTANTPVPPHGEDADSPGGPGPGLNAAGGTSAKGPAVVGFPPTNGVVPSCHPTGDADSYAEVLYEKVLHEIKQGNIIDRQKKLTQKNLYAYIQEVFGVDEAKHALLEQRVDSMLEQDIFLRVEIMEAKLTGYADAPEQRLPNAFVVVYLQEKPREIVKTAIVPNTSNPAWNQQFPVPVKQDTKETLLIEVFNYSSNPNKFLRAFRIARKYVLSFFNPVASHSKMIGRASIPLESITSTGLVSWYNLTKKKKPEPQGTIKLKFFFTSKLEKATAKREYEQMLRCILQYELRSSNVARYWWAGKFTGEGEAILQQYTKCANLNVTEQTLIAWFIYTQVHLSHSLSFVLLENLLDKLSTAYEVALTNDEERDRFWEGLRRILPSCLSIIVKMRKRIAGDKDIVKTVTTVLQLLAKASQLATKKGVHLFDDGTVRILKEMQLICKKHSTMKEATVLAVQLGARTWFETSLNAAIEGYQSNEDKMRCLIKFVMLLQSDLIRAKTYYDSVFKSIMDIDYGREICIQHEALIVSNLRPIVQKICDSFKKITLRKDQLERHAEMERLDMSSTLFELYLILKLFLQQTDTVVQCAHNPYIVEFHQWFRGGIVYYLDVFAIKTFSRVVTVLGEDDLKAVSGSTKDHQKFTSSAAEILDIIGQVKIFWGQLAWPDKDDMQKFLKRSIGDICSCCIFYADRLLAKVNAMDKPEEGSPKLDQSSNLATLERSLMVLSNVNILFENLSQLPQELGYSQQRTSGDVSNPDRARKTSLEQFEEVLPINGLSNWREKCVRFISDHVSQTTRGLVVACGEVGLNGGGPMGQLSGGSGGLFSSKPQQTAAQHAKRLEVWTVGSSTLLQAELKVTDLRMVEQSLWTTLETTMDEIIKKLSEKKDSLATFKRLLEAFELLTHHFFRTIEETVACSTIRERLETFSSTTNELIHRYYLERCRQQENLEEPENGELTVRCWFQSNELHIKVVRAKQLRLPKNYKHTCDSYVKINVMPADRFGALPELKTKTKSKNFSPEYNETFKLKINPAQHSLENALLMVNVKVSELLGITQKHIGECFLRLDAIPVVHDPSEVADIESIIPLSLPFNITEFCSLTALETRTHDKAATLFLKKLKQKMGIAPYTMSSLSL